MRSDDKATRKDTPLYSGVLAYFPDALLEVARVSKAGNDQHNPGTPLHWDRSKSGDEYDALTRHLIDRAAGVLTDTDGQRHMAKVAWRALAALQKEIESDREVLANNPYEAVNLDNEIGAVYESENSSGNVTITDAERRLKYMRLGEPEPRS